MDFEQDGLVPADITEIMGVVGVEPTTTWICGQRYNDDFTHNESGWEINSGLVTGINAGDRAQLLCDSVSTQLQWIRDNQEVNSWNYWSMRLIIEAHCDKGSPDLVFQDAFVEDLGNLGISLLIEVHTEPKPQRPKVGITSMTTHRGKMLVGLRQGSHGENELAFPGGHQEWHETWEETAVTETGQEVGDGKGGGLEVEPRHHREPYLFVTDNLMKEDKRHYTTVWVHCTPVEEVDVTIKLPGLEEGKCKEWMWMDLHEVICRLLGKSEYSWDDINHQEERQAHWLPIKKLLKYHKELGLQWPFQLPYSTTR
jgi:8-oxo-dGTP diphosphatase